MTQEGKTKAFLVSFFIQTGDGKKQLSHFILFRGKEGLFIAFKPDRIVIRDIGT